MFTQKWREHWNLREEPFVCEDADKDDILQSMDSAAVHSGFDRVYGNPRVPAPAVVFGEKGSGKSALRLMMRRRLEQFNQENPDEKVFLIEYIDFNGFLENFKHKANVKGDSEKAAQKVVSRWKVAHHLDCVLSLGITKLVDQIVEHKQSLKHLPHKNKIDLLLAAALYYQSEQRTTSESLTHLKQMARFGGARPALILTLCIVLSLICVAGGSLPLWIGLTDLAPEDPAASPLTNPDNLRLFLGAGLAGLAVIWGWYLIARLIPRSRAKAAVRAIKALNKDHRHAARILEQLPPRERQDFVLPSRGEEAGRYEWLHRILDLLEFFGYKGVYVVIDRLDEPSLLGGRDTVMREFIGKILDIKLLQYPRLGLKLFLPIELDDIQRTSSPEQLKKMRLDKSNLIPELKWSGQELYEIANQRMLACATDPERAPVLSDLFAEEIGFDHLKETLTQLGTPRYAFGFLSELFNDHIKELPNDLADDDARWLVSRERFEVIRSAWLGRTGVLRRMLN